MFLFFYCQTSLIKINPYLNLAISWVPYITAILRDIIQ